MNIAREIGEALYGLGIRRAYGLPGEDHMALLAELDAVGIGYRTAYNETSAVIMAATDARLTGLPGVAVLSLAPGISNGLNGILDAYLEQVPLLVLSGQHPAAQAPLVVRQGFDLGRLVAPVTKWQAKITAGAPVASVIGKAVDEALSGPPGPVYLELPDDVATAEAADGAGRPAAAAAALARRWTEGQADRRTPSGPAVTALAGRLAAAARPAVVIGGRRRRVTPPTAARFAARFRAPAFTTSNQKGVLTAASPYYAGTFLNGRLERRLLADCDFVLLVDPDPFDFYNRPWNFDCECAALTEDGFTEWLNPVGEQYATDAEGMLTALLADPRPVQSRWAEQDVKEYREHVRASLLGPGGPVLSVARAVDAALSALPPDGYLVADAGFAKPLVALLSEPGRPGRFLASNALSTMGYSVPAALAAGRASAAPVLAFLGDGSLLMRATELAGAGGSGSRTVFVAIMDRSLSQIGIKQRRRDLTPVGVDLPAVSCARLGPALGVEAVDVTGAAELTAAVRAGLDGAGPLLVGAQVDPSASPAVFELLRG